MRHPLLWSTMSDLVGTEGKAAKSVPCRLDGLTGMVVLRHITPLWRKGGSGTMSDLDSSSQYVAICPVTSQTSHFGRIRGADRFLGKSPAATWHIRTDDVHTRHAEWRTRRRVFPTGNVPQTEKLIQNNEQDPGLVFVVTFTSMCVSTFRLNFYRVCTLTSIRHGKSWKSQDLGYGIPLHL